MAAPNYVPTRPTDRPRCYQSPPRRGNSWRPTRPADLLDGQPAGNRLGSQGPDQGYALTLVHEFEGRLHCGAVHEADAVAGAVAVALKRASSYGRAPLVHDLTAGFTVWGFLDEDAPAELVELRQTLFAEIANEHHYVERRRVADLVPVGGLRQLSAAIDEQYRADWKQLINPD
ncbi:MAG: hypothetical protein GY745_08175 [Actinomycetia bacterium]|nr:hypothetical protein [Actinomycetes bacterium]MCP4085011.1 hypothetical protein [Actinomycetes bacterium]